MSLQEALREIDHAFTRKDLKGPSFENVVSSAASFLRRKNTKSLKDVDIAVAGLPFDQAVTKRPSMWLFARDSKQTWPDQRHPV